MRQFRFFKAIKVALFVVVASTILGFVVKSLWNVLVPPIFGWHIITFWQGIGLLLLCKILFGGFHRHGRGGRSPWGHRMKERWEKMTPEEQEKFRKGMRCGRGPFASPAEPQVGTQI
jgi:hypothetical protein